MSGDLETRKEINRSLGLAQADSENEDDDRIGRQVAVKFDNKMDTGIITSYDPQTKLYTVDFDDETVYDNIEESELIFMDE